MTCEGCGAPAGHMDRDGTELCCRCWDSLVRDWASQARAEGAAEERERIAAACDREARKWARPGDFHPTDSTVAYEHAARIARGV